jgi:hypothetical protein
MFENQVFIESAISPYETVNELKPVFIPLILTCFELKKGVLCIFKAKNKF